jgi:sugar (pentulose or hexulose) kinase
VSVQNVYVGIDLGSTTTKAVVLDKDARIIGRGVTKSRSNYDIDCRIAREEAFVQARLLLLRSALSQGNALGAAKIHSSEVCFATYDSSCTSRDWIPFAKH